MAKQKPDRYRWPSSLITGLIILGLAVAVIAVQMLGSAQPASPQGMSLDPQIIANLTQLPQATPISGDSAVQVNQLRTLVQSCPDYTSERRSQMEQHLEWLETPALIPSQIIIALGPNPTGRLIFGMATYTSIQWNLVDNIPNSCLLPIGKLLNEMLIAAEEEPFPIFN
jgi:hypothetical protein